MTDGALFGAGAAAAYATAAQYFDRNSGGRADADRRSMIEEVLTAASRFIDRLLGWGPCAFAPLPASTRHFWPGRATSRVLRLRDVEGQLWPLRDWTAVEVDYDGTGAADYSWTAADAGWLLKEPDSPHRPARALRIWGSHRDAEVSAWPAAPGRVSVSAAWGHAAIPGPVTEMTIHIARGVLDSHQGGAAAAVQALNAGIHVPDSARRMWRLFEMEHSAGRMARLGLTAATGLTGR